MEQPSKQRVLFTDLTDKPVAVQFSVPGQSSDGGAVLLKRLDERLGLSERLSEALVDPRELGKVEHPLRCLLQQRVFAIACGYPDQNDAARLADDPIMKLICNHQPVVGESSLPLASQPTLSRFENAATRTDLLRMSYALTDVVIEEQRGRRGGRRGARAVRRITIDLDPTDDLTHGQQQMTFFNTYYGGWCYLPMIVTIQFADAPREQHLVAVMLRPGNAPGSQGATSILKRLVPRLRRAFPRAKLRVRGDGAFCTPEVLDWLEAQGLEYLINLPKHAVLTKRADVQRGLRKARRQTRASGKSERVFGEFTYKAGTWSRRRRVIFKAEVTVAPAAQQPRESKDNPRFVVTNRKRGTPRGEYARYVGRGEMENRIKEMLLGLRFDLTSCTSFRANQFRELLTAAAYILFQQLRYGARRTQMHRAQVSTLRERLIKIGVRVTESVRRIVLEGPKSYPWQQEWLCIASACGARFG